MLKPYIEKSLGTQEPRIVHKFQIADTYSSSFSAPALTPCAEYQGSPPSIGFSRFYGCTPLCNVVYVCVRAHACTCAHAFSHWPASLLTKSLYCLTLLQWEPQGSTA